MEHVDLAAVDAVLLDMDGTLVDSDAAVERSWHRWAEEFAVDPAEVLAIAHGSPAERTVRRVRPDLDAAGVRAAAGRQLQFEYEDLADVTATPGAHRLLAVLDRLGIAWAVVTSADARLARLRLGAAAIKPPVLVTFEDVTAGKPDPEGYGRAARLLGVPPARCLAVEDAEPGIRAGHGAGMGRVCTGGTRFRHPQLEPRTVRIVRIYERGPDGRLAAVRVYDDVEAPVGRR